jgi:NTP pyrophosphatase (non-canonical NTP hydrolase)
MNTQENIFDSILATVAPHDLKNDVRHDSRPVLREVDRERARQDSIWGEQNHHPDYWLSILTEEVGEVARAICDRSWLSYREELIHVAAVAVSMAECHDRNHGKGSSHA